ncbi:hypothetical protein [Methylobacterium aquaticum]|uniref:Pam3-gp28 family putative phage holin n=1 Tax=Methylobacterium aquaticum TaxID=270351 RepID=UPI0019349065|nr:hypothetical protein [Methylobacterium aquaticum]QRE74424.1 hypothetical protein F1D61_13130 [Methylobacterium aquaticum]
MNQEQLTALLRTLLQFGGGIAVGRGWIDADTATALTGALVTLLVTVWGLYVRRNAGLVASAAALPTVKTILADPVTANAIPSAKVQPAE